MGWNPLNVLKAPKMHTASLPYDVIDEKRQAANWNPELEKPPHKTKSFEQAPHRRAITPHPILKKGQHEQAYPNPPVRTRTISQGYVTGATPSGMVGPPKVVAEAAHPTQISVPPHSNRGRPTMEHYAGHNPSAMSGISHSASSNYPGNSHTPMHRHGDVQMSRHGTMPTYVPATAANHRQSRYHSISGHPPPQPAREEKSKYRKAYIVQVPQKAEAISLSWPLVRPGTQKRGRTKIYFDVAFDPRDDNADKVRVYEGGPSRAISAQELDMSVSTHCEITEMTIICPDFEQWPIHIKREKGIRCRDVFNAVYNTFHVRLTAEEKARIDGETLERCKRYFEQRCVDAPGLPEFNRRQGMVRADVLRSRRLFGGLTRVGKDWELHLDRNVP